jgi:hypothetical protein
MLGLLFMSGPVVLLRSARSREAAHPSTEGEQRDLLSPLGVSSPLGHRQSEELTIYGHAGAAVNHSTLWAIRRATSLSDDERTQLVGLSLDLTPGSARGRCASATRRMPIPIEVASVVLLSG